MGRLCSAAADFIHSLRMPTVVKRTMRSFLARTLALSDRSQYKPIYCSAAAVSTCNPRDVYPNSRRIQRAICD
jgi:hypothetical protein